MTESVLITIGVAGLILLFGLLIMFAKMYQKAAQGEALVRTGVGDTRVSFSGLLVFPVLHKLEIMDISLKTVVIARTGKEGLICKDNMRADIKVTFFVKVNKTREDVVQVAQAIGCRRASDPRALEELFDAKFSEALKTVGKHFDFVELYNSRERFKEEILNIIGTDLNGYILDDAAIDYLEQTPLEFLNNHNILDAEGIKKITDLTSKQMVLSNYIERDKEKTIKQQDVEAREAILELERQLAETEEKQKKEVSTIRSREEAEAETVRHQERLKSEKARIATDEEVEVALQNKYRQITVASKNKERTEKVESERVEKDRALEAVERERIVTLAEIEKEKAVEIEKKNIQDVIRERVMVQKSVVEEEEKIKDTQAWAAADRTKKVAITAAEQAAEESLVQEIKAAEAAKQAANHQAEKLRVEATAEQETASQKADAIKILADAKASEAAALGLAEAQVMQAKAKAREAQGEAEASVIEDQAVAESKGIQAKAHAQAEANQKIGFAEAEVIRAKASADKERGMAEAEVSSEKLTVEAKGIEDKANAMKVLNDAGKEHEEFKLKLDKEKAVELATIEIQKSIADAQAAVISEALRASKIDIVGGETMFFDKIIGSITRGKSWDRMMDNSRLLNDVKDRLLNGQNGSDLKDNLRNLIGQFGLSTEDVKNLSIAALILKLSGMTKNAETKDMLNNLLDMARSTGVADHSAEILDV